MLDLHTIFEPLRLAAPGHDERIAAWQSEASDWLAADYTVRQGRALFVDGGGAVRRWDFGDPAARFNVLPGYNAAHVYDIPGTYSITRSDADGSNRLQQMVRVVPASANVMPVPAGSDLAAAVAAAPAGATLQLERGATYDIRRSMRVAVADLTVGAAAGTGPLPRIRMVATTKTYAFYVAAGAALAVDAIEFDSDVPLGAPVAKIDRHAFFVQSGSLTVRNCRARHLDNFIEGSGGAAGVLVQDCECTNELRSCFVWIDGCDYVLLGNSAADSNFEHIVRSSQPAVQRVLLFENDFANPPIRTKESFTFRKGSFLYAGRNTFRFGWVQVSEGKPQPTTQARHVVFADNTLTDGAWLEVKPACEDVLLSGNTIVDPGSVDNPVHVTGNCRVRVENNLWRRKSPTTRSFVARYPVNTLPPLVPDVSESGNTIAVQP